MIKPQPYKVTCNQCAWTKSFAPVSDVILQTDRPDCCPNCKSDDINYSNINAISSLLLKLLQR